MTTHPVNTCVTRSFTSLCLGSGITHRDVGNADIAGANICPCRNDGIPQTWVHDERSLSWESVNDAGYHAVSEKPTADVFFVPFVLFVDNA